MLSYDEARSQFRQSCLGSLNHRRIESAKKEGSCHSCIAYSVASGRGHRHCSHEEVRKAFDEFYKNGKIHGEFSPEQLEIIFKDFSATNMFAICDLFKRKQQ